MTDRLGDIDKLFASHQLNATGIQRVSYIRQDFTSMLNSIVTYCAASPREYAIVRTLLEEACMYAIKAVALNEENKGE